MSTEHARANSAWGDAEPTPRWWRSGPWALELRGDELADITYRGAPVLRSVRAVVRDRDWNTVPGAVTAVRDACNVLEIEVEFAGYGAELGGVVRVRASDSDLVVDFEAENRRDFESCRIGLVVLHSPSLAGSALEVGHPDGSRTSTAFPTAVSPHQPALDIARLGWSTPQGIGVDVRFEGEIFEMEDQRNWTDASFKTYGTPLSQPFPVLVPAGEKLHQAVHITCAGEPRVEPAIVVVDLVSVEGAMPEIVVGAATGPEMRAVEGVAAVRLVELDLRDASWPAALVRARDEVPGGRLDVRLVTPDAASVARALDALVGVPLVRLAVFASDSHVTEPALWAALTEGVAARGIVAELVGGARTHYAELNRTRERLPAGIPALTFSVTPQMHARERAQLVESIPMIRVVAADAVAQGGGRPMHVGPITLRPRVNAVATVPVPADERPDLDHGYGPERETSSTDPRQASDAVASWAIAAIAAASILGVASIAVFESSGPRGLVDAGHPDGMPVLGAVRAATALVGLPLLVAVRAPVGVSVLAVRSGATVHLIAANLTSASIEAACSIDGAPTGFMLRLDPWAWEAFSFPA